MSARATMCGFLALVVSTTNATTYYVDCNKGNDGNSGLSDEQAWKTAAKVNEVVSGTGDDVYFKAGSTCPGTQIIIDWPGTSTDRAVIGSYYMNNGVETVGVPAGTPKPIIKGTYPLFETSGAVPTNRYWGLAHIVREMSYVTVKNLRLTHSSGMGVSVGQKSHHVIVEGMEIISPAGSGVTFNKHTHNNIFRNNYSYEAGKARADGRMDGNGVSCHTFSSSWNNIAEGNFIEKCRGESLSAWGHANERSDNNIFRNNTIVHPRSLGIYLTQSSNNTIENNLIIGEGPGTTSTGFSLAIEPLKGVPLDSSGNIFRNNIIANVNMCFWMGVDSSQSDKSIGAKVIGNTCVTTDRVTQLWNLGSNYKSLEVANNLFTDIKNSNSPCSIPSSSTINFHHNSWDINPSDADCVGSGDVYGNVDIATNISWKDVKPNNIPTPASFYPADDIKVLTSGVEHADLRTDFNGSMRPTPPAMGAVNSDGSSATKSLDKPQGLRLNIFN